MLNDLEQNLAAEDRICIVNLWIPLKIYYFTVSTLGYMYCCECVSMFLYPIQDVLPAPGLLVLTLKADQTDCKPLHKLPSIPTFIQIP